MHRVSLWSLHLGACVVRLALQLGVAGGDVVGVQDAGQCLEHRVGAVGAYAGEQGLRPVVAGVAVVLCAVVLTAVASPVSGVEAIRAVLLTARVPWSDWAIGMPRTPTRTPTRPEIRWRTPMFTDVQIPVLTCAD